MGNDSTRIEEHYAKLAHTYDDDWAYSEEFLYWMSHELAMRLGDLRGGDLLDVGAGTGLYSARVGALVNADHVMAIDPSPEMLSKIPGKSGVVPIRASAEDLPRLWAARNGGPVGGIMIKEAVHHMADKDTTLGGLASLLAPGGRIVIAMLPESIGYPLFDAALRLFERIQPSPRLVQEALENAGLRCRKDTAGFRLRLPRERYHNMVANRYMSLLTNFDDEALAAGLQEMRSKHAGLDVLEFEDEFVFVSGVLAERC